MKKNRFLFGFVLFAIVSILAGYGYGPSKADIDNLDELTYAEGQFDYYHTKRKWRSRRKGSQPFRKYLIIYLEDHPARYKDGEYLLENLEQNALLMAFNGWPKDTLQIGYLESDDSGLRLMYDIKYDGKSLVDIEGIKEDMRKEALMLLIFSIVGGILSVLSLAKHIYDSKKIANAS